LWPNTSFNDNDPLPLRILCMQHRVGGRTQSRSRARAKAPAT
jgi:hypothetical protein